MAKITKSGLKNIVKECLVEILSEGLNPSISTTAIVKKKKVARKQEEQRLIEHRKKFEYKIEDAISGITDDSVMADILRDTAKNTLQEQIEDSSGLKSENQNPGVNLDGIFGNASDNWKKLAFDDKSSGR